MALDLGTPVTAGEYLYRVSVDVARMEGDCKEEDRVHVTCRQLTEGEERHVQALRRGARKYSWDPATDRPETSDQTDWYLYNRELAWHSMTAVRNLKRDGKNIFRRTNAGWMNGNRDDFDEAWDSLPSSVAFAITLVALSVNPTMDALGFVRPRPLAWLAEKYPEVSEEMDKWVKSETEKNLLERGTPG